VVPASSALLLVQMGHSRHRVYNNNAWH
jgi:hypothetical protein